MRSRNTILMLALTILSQAGWSQVVNPDPGSAGDPVSTNNGLVVSLQVDPRPLTFGRITSAVGRLDCS